MPTSKISQGHLTELQAVREVLFMLAGLPTSLFLTGNGSIIQYKPGHALTHALPGTLVSVLGSFASLGSALLALRHWAQKQQSISLLQTFRAVIQHHIGTFDASLSKIQQQYLDPPAGVVVSLLDVQQRVRNLAGPLLRLATVALEKSGSGPFAYLEALFDEMNVAQLSGETEIFAILGDAFFTCLQTYLKPIREWMEDGELGLDEQIFFVSISQQDQSASSSSLWHDRFKLRKNRTGSLYAPNFLHPAAQKIFNTGKSVVFLKELSSFETDTSLAQEEPALDFESVCGSAAGTLFRPFSELFEAAFDDWIRSKYSQAAATLRNYLFTQCELLRSLDAMQAVYLCKDGIVFQNFADAVFAKVDRNAASWNDRFLLTELAQNAFGEYASIDAERITARSKKLKIKSRTVKNLPSFVLDYQVSGDFVLDCVRIIYVNQRENVSNQHCSCPGLSSM
jgi:gamma-tubulin complex component 5